MKIILTFIMLGILTFARGAGPNLSTTLSLDGQWNFALASDESAAQALSGFKADGFDASAFRPIPVPSNWVMQGFEEPHYVNGTKSEGFYLHSFPVPAELKDKRTLLRFGGVWQSAEVWLNGVLLGRHDSGFTGFAFNATDALKPGETNRLAVRVRQQTPLFKLDANDDWALPGIYRGVWLETCPKEWNLENVEVVTDFDDDFRDATLRLRAFVMRHDKENYLSISPPFEVRAVLSRDGREVGRASSTGTITGGHNGSDVPLELKVSAPAAWTAESPALYDLRVELIRGGNVEHAWEDRIGFREVDTDGGVFRINGQPVKLRGVARHDQHPDVGRATRREHWLEDIRLMKAANINAVRTAHYPPAEGFVRLCDEMGLYVIEEVPYGFGGERMNDPSYAEGAFLRVYETVNRDRNRPAVVVWSVGNEDPFTALHLATLRALKGLDPTRPTLMPFRADESLPPEVDILAPHYWTAADYDAFAAKARRPIISTEYSHAMGPDDFGGLADRWNSLTKHPAGAGAMIWLWADQGLRRPVNGRPVLDPMKDKAKYTREGSELVRESDAGKNEIYDAHGNLGTDGIVDADRTPQIDYWETKAVYSPVRVLVDRVDFKPGQAEVVIPLRNDYDFTDLSTVTAHWKLFFNADLVAQGKTKLKGAPHQKTALKLPTDGLSEGACYLHLAFIDQNQHEISRHSVRLGDSASAEASVKPEAGAKPTVEEKDGLVRVMAGKSAYTFDPKRGMISSVEIDGKPFANGSDLLVWRDATYCERQFLDKRKPTYDWETYLQGLPATASAWNVAESADGVTLTSTVTFQADEKSRVEADFTHRISANGALSIDYVVRPSVDVDWLLDLGIGLKLVDQPMTAEWLGWGPGHSLENRHESALFGQWTIPVFSAEARKTRSGVEWLKVNLPEGRAMLVKGLTAFRFDGGTKEEPGGMLRMLNKTAGASVKGGIPEREEWRISLTEGKGEFRGALELLPLTDAAPAVPAHPAVVSTAIINENAPYPESHASTIVEIAPGQLAASWFGGTKERNPDVVIWFARQENGKWQPAIQVADGIQADGSPRLPTWNPVLFAPKDAPLQLFYKIGPHPSTWWGMLITSTDGGKTWSEPMRLPDKLLGPIKNKPVMLDDGSWLSPSSTEGTPDGWVAHFEISKDQGRTWDFIGPVAKGGGFGLEMIQPSVLFHPGGKLQALGRTRDGVTASTWSTDQGRSWSLLTRLAVPNTNSGTDAVTLADGRHLLVFNDTAPPPERKNKGVRYPVNVAISNDGITWSTVLTLDHAPCAAGYAYPAVIQAADGMIHITYTSNRQVIKHVVLDPVKL